MQNDLARCAFSAEDIKCVVFDEAHKALGNHSYCQVGSSILITFLHMHVLAVCVRILRTVFDTYIQYVFYEIFLIYLCIYNMF